MALPDFPQLVESVRAGARQVSPLVPAATHYEKLQELVRSPEFQVIQQADQAEGNDQRQVFWLSQYMNKYTPEAFSNVAEPERANVARTQLQRLMAPTKGEKIQKSFEKAGPFVGGLAGSAIGMAPAIATMNPVTGGLIEGAATTLGATAGHALPELTRPILTGKFGSPVEAVTEHLPEIETQGIFGAGGRVIGDVVSRTIGGIRSKWMNPEGQSETTRTAREVLEPAGGRVTPYQQSGEASRGPVEIVEDTLRSAFGSSGLFRKLEQKNEAIIQDALESAKGQLTNALQPRELAAAIIQARKDGKTLGMKAADALWKSLQPEIELAEQTVRRPFRIPTSNLLSFLNREGESLNVELALKSGGGVRKLEDFLQTIQQPAIPSFKGMPGFPAVKASEATYENLREFVTRMGDVSRTASDEGVKKTAGKLKAMAEDSLRQAFDDYGVPQLKLLYQTAKQETAKVHQTFDNELLLSVVSRAHKDPGAVADLLFNAGTKKEKLDTLLAVNSLSPALKQTVQESLASRMIEQSMEREVVSGGLTKMDGLKLVQTYKQHDPAFLDQAIGKDMSANLRRLATALEVAERVPSGGASVYIRLAQAGALTGAATLGPTAGSKLGGVALILGGPWVLGKIMISKSATENFAEGLIGGPTSGAFRRFMTQTAAQLGPGAVVTEQLGQFHTPLGGSGLPAPPRAFENMLQPLNAPPQISMPTIDQTIQQSEQIYNLPPGIMRAVIQAESNFDWRAQSKAGAQGGTQLMPATQREVGVTDPFDPVQSVQGGAKHLGRLYKKYGGDLQLALAAYNAGEGTVAKYHGVPPIKETRQYIQKVMGNLRKMRENVVE